MKRLLWLLAVIFLLWGCQSAPAETAIQISLVEEPGFTVEQNGQWVQPGDTAVFRLKMDRGVSLSGTDYPGTYSAEVKDGVLELTLEQVQYPAQVRLRLTTQYATITYDPNGAAQDAVVTTQDMSLHARPNTQTKLFTRPGWTQVAWNTKADGSGTRIGLGSRVSAGVSLTLYAQWVPWADERCFTYSENETGLTIEAYSGADAILGIPAQIDGRDVTKIAAGAFTNCNATQIVLPNTVDVVEPGAFTACALESLVLFDNIQQIGDDCFRDCPAFATLYINAYEPPYGYEFRKESMYADKVDLLIQAQGQRKMVFYGGCSVWYNLTGRSAYKTFGEDYRIINMGLNGTVNSLVQMKILDHFLEEGDLVLHTLELSSSCQLLTRIDLGTKDDKLWCGLEYNYDLFSLVDLRELTGTFDSLNYYLSIKKTATSYEGWYFDENDNSFFDQYGGVPFDRSTTREDLADKVGLDPTYLDPVGIARLEAIYGAWQERGITVYLSYACVNMDAVPEDQRGNVALLDQAVKSAFATPVISDLEDFLYTNTDFYDTNYHLRSQVALENTWVWVRDLKARMTADGLWSEPET